MESFDMAGSQGYEASSVEIAGTEILWLTIRLAVQLTVNRNSVKLRTFGQESAFPAA
jgi:hypothetical protein